MVWAAITLRFAVCICLAVHMCGVSQKNCKEIIKDAVSEWNTRASEMEIERLQRERDTAAKLVVSYRKSKQECEKRDGIYKEEIQTLKIMIG